MKIVPYFVTGRDVTSSFKLSKSAWVRDKAMTSAPHSTNILAVLRPIPLNKKIPVIFYNINVFLKSRRRPYKLSFADLINPIFCVTLNFINS